MSLSTMNALLLPIYEIFLKSGKPILCPGGGSSLQIVGPRVLLTLTANNIPTISLHVECEVDCCSITNPNDNEFDYSFVVMILDVSLSRQLSQQVREFWNIEGDSVCKTRLGVRFEATSKGWIQQHYELFVSSLRRNFYRGEWRYLNGIDISMECWMDLSALSDKESNEVVVGIDDAARVSSSKVSDDDVDIVSDDVREEEVLDADNVPGAGAVHENEDGHILLKDNFLPTDRLTWEDFRRLEPGEWLNDSLIDLFMSYFQRTVDPSLTKRVSIPISFFVPNLRSKGPSSVERWETSVNLFEVDHVLIPVHTSCKDHWYLIIIDHPSWSQDIGDTDFAKTIIFVLDSMESSNQDKDVGLIKSWLQHMVEKKGKAVRDIDVVSARVPVQPNSDDCGLYVLQFSRVFLQNPIGIRQEMMKSAGSSGQRDHINEVWGKKTMKGMREELKSIILNGD